MDRSYSLLDMDFQWRTGTWIGKGREKILLNDEIDDERLVNIAHHLKSHAISHWHYNYFYNRALGNSSECNRILTVYDEGFPQLILRTLELHPSWSFVKNQLIRRDLWDNFVRSIR